MKDKIYILGIDGGGTSTTACLFNQRGETINEITIGCTNLYSGKEYSIKELCILIQTIAEKSKISLEEISSYGLALAGASDINHREMLLKELDRMKISSKSIILSDTEAAFNLLCPTGTGIMISVGTGIMCMARDLKGKSYFKAGKGYDNDIGSGYWIAKQVLNKLILNESLINIDSDVNSLYTMTLKKFDVNTLELISNYLIDESAVSKIASLSKDILVLAEEGNDIALSIIQEATRNVADYILDLLEEMNYDNKDIIFARNGSVINNNFYRKCLNQALEFDFKKIHWVSSNISPAYSAGVMSAACLNINVSINNIIKYIKNQ